MKLLVKNGESQVDDDGFVALVDAAYDGYIDENWTVSQILERFARERRAEHAVIAFPGPDLADSPVRLATAPTRLVVRSFHASLTVTNGRIWLSTYAQLTMAAQYDDEAAMVSYTPWIDVANGRYLVTVQQTRKFLTRAHRIHITLEPLDPGSGSADTAQSLVPWCENTNGLDTP